MTITPAILTRAAHIKLLACDVDGVLTDGSITYGDGDLALKTFNVKDGLGIVLAGESGLPVVLITGRTSAAVARRAKELRVQVYQGVMDKDAQLRRVAADAGVALDDVAYIGDDLNDLPALRIAGLPVAVADAAADVRAQAAYTTHHPGGRGAVREIVELIFTAQGRWDTVVESYLARLRVAQLSQ